MIDRRHGENMAATSTVISSKMTINNPWLSPRRNSLKKWLHNDSRCYLKLVYYHYYHDIYIYTYTYIHTYIHTFIHSYIHTCIHSYIHTFIHSSIHTYMHIYIHSYIHTFIHSYIQTFMHLYIYIYIIHDSQLFDTWFHQHRPTRPGGLWEALEELLKRAQRLFLWQVACGAPGLGKGGDTVVDWFVAAIIYIYTYIYICVYINIYIYVCVYIYICM